MEKAALIARKHEIQGKLAQARRELNRLQSPAPGAENPAPDRATQRRIRQLQTTVEQLMAEEYRLRLTIDRT